MEDVLGPGYEARTLPLGSDAEGEVVATLVTRRADQPTRAAVLYVHGFVDYFFQTHLADFFVGQGFDFYALDLRKYGRSLRPWQTPNLAHSLSDYFPELDEAVSIIRADHDVVVVNAHSTGGLITPLWADRVRGQGLIQGLALNSPFFDMNVPVPARVVGDVLSTALSGIAPRIKLPSGWSTRYAESLHEDYAGEWAFDLEWKPLAGFGVRAAWLASIRRGQRRLQAGLDIDVPVLVMASERKVGRSRRDDMLAGDAVLDPEQMARWAPKLGRDVTVVRFEGGLHDLVLSPAPVRERVFKELAEWLGPIRP